MNKKTFERVIFLGLLKPSFAVKRSQKAKEHGRKGPIFAAAHVITKPSIIQAL
jgi:hypothetical protein